MDDREILDVIQGLVAEEHTLRELRDRGEISEDAEVTRLAQLERNLDQMWDALRRRRAMRAAGLDPDSEQEAMQQVDSSVQ